jgi:hypothetical protein
MQAVQNNYYDAPERGFAGQLFNAGSDFGNAIFSGATTEDLYCGRAVALATNAADFDGSLTLKTVSGITDAADIAGILRLDAQAISDIDGDVYVQSKTMATFARANRGALIYVKADMSVTIAAGDDVYVATNATNDQGIKLGEFTNTSGAGLLKTNFKYYSGNGKGKMAIIELVDVIVPATENGGGE